VTDFNERPWAPPAASARVSHVRGIVLAVDIPSVPRAYQARAQAQTPVEPVLALASAGSNGTTGFTGAGVQAGNKGMDVRGVPPRGKPV
jgi:hypothetical protein